MIAWGHTAVGAAIGLTAYHYLVVDTQSTNLLNLSTITVGCSIVSHYITDFIPHGHFTKFKNFKKEVLRNLFFDVFLSVFTFIVFAYYFSGSLVKTYFISLGIIGALLPDILDGLIYTNLLPKNKLLKVELDFHTNVHWHGAKENGLVISLIDLWQLIVVVIILIQLLINF